MTQAGSRASFRNCLSGCWDKYLGGFTVGSAGQRMLQGRNGATQHAGRRMASPIMLANAGTHADKSRSIEQRHHDGAGGQPHMTDHVSHSVTLDSGGGGRTALPCCQGRCPQQQIRKAAPKFPGAHINPNHAARYSIAERLSPASNARVGGRPHLRKRSSAGRQLEGSWEHSSGVWRCHEPGRLGSHDGVEERRYS